MKTSRLTSMLAAAAIASAVLAAPAGAYAGTAYRAMSDGSHADTNTSISESAALSWIAYDNHAKGYYKDAGGTVSWVVLCDGRVYHLLSSSVRSIAWQNTKDLTVEHIQYTLNYMDNSDFNIEYDGYYGPITKSVVTEYQYHRNAVHGETLATDGIVGRYTYYSMSKCVE